MKLIIQIPCHNEASSLAGLSKEIPRNIERIDKIETLLIDDGSTDHTKEVAKSLGFDHITNFPSRRGLAKAFMAGIDTSLKLGADIIVNIDGDGQYDPREIPELIRPIMEGRADMVIGDRGTDKLAHFSFAKKKMQKLGSWVVRKISGTYVPDATSGFRAFSRQAALSLNVISDFTYTLETLIQAGNENIAFEYVSVTSRPVMRRSRLFKSLKEYLVKSAATIIRIYTMYKPLKVFSIISFFIFILGLFLFCRFLYLRAVNPGVRPIQHLIAASVIILFSFQIFLIGLVSDLISANRKLIENTLKRVKNLELSGKKKN